MHLQSFRVGPFAENTYMLSKDGKAVLIDPGFSNKEEFNQLETALKNDRSSLQAIILTHAHVDHIIGIPLVLSRYEIPVYLCDKDYYLWENYSIQAKKFGFQVEDFDFIPEILPIKEEWNIEGFTFEVRYTPGHAPDHISLYSKQDDLLIVGDALFREGVGRTDLYKGDMKILKTSIREQLYTLPENTTVCPGHGPETTIGHEKKANPFVQAK